MNKPSFEFTETDKRHVLYHTWWNMLARCYIEIAPGFSDYGGRGLTVSESWFTFKNFANDMGNAKPKGMSIDRINNDLGYSKENCKWSNRTDQMLNRRTFGNNTTGETGIVRINKRYEARYHYDGVRYRIGMYDNVNDAKTARLGFIEHFNQDREGAVESISKPTIWCTSNTKIRGISEHKDGGYIVRVTIAGKRIYVGYFKTIDEAIDARREYD